ncbi:MAG: hypothetical protein BWY82_02271 [Verrucomicrobia bacterium ADurb.Bin474]|nr:MAG: hypothetical protein BWY82_02271 [Verrucomicrobia bacterium ADurb.Bin474]
MNVALESGNASYPRRVDFFLAESGQILKFKIPDLPYLFRISLRHRQIGALQPEGPPTVF